MAITAPPAASTGSTNKIVYIDHIRVILTILVVLHHTFITYGAPGGWYYYQKTTNEIIKGPLTFFVAVNQSFFMGFFFFLSAYFIRPSLEKKGPAKFVKDRLIRLGIPLLFYTFIFGPVLNYLVYYFGKGKHISIIQYLRGYDDWIDFGVLWFVVALLSFTLLYVAYRAVSKNIKSRSIPLPSLGGIMLFAAVLGLVSFLVRLVFPLGWVLPLAGFQLAHFTQYIALFICGILASKYNWLDSITIQQGRRGLLIARLVGIFGFVLFYVMLATMKFPSDWFNGGFHLPAFAYAMWEQLTGLAIIVAFLGIGREKMNNDSPRWRKMSRAAFAVYIFHPLAIVSLALLATPIPIEPAIKLLFVGPLAVIGSFLLASVIVKIPGVNKII